MVARDRSCGGPAPFDAHARGAATAMQFTRPDIIRVFDRDPDLLQGVAEPAASTCDRTRDRPHPRQPRALVPRLGRPGPLRASRLARDRRPAGEDAAARRPRMLGDRRPRRPPSTVGRRGSLGDSVPAQSWRVLAATVLASLDARFAARTARWPTIAAALLGRSTAALPVAGAPGDDRARAQCRHPGAAGALAARRPLGAGHVARYRRPRPADTPAARRADVPATPDRQLGAGQARAAGPAHAAARAAGSSTASRRPAAPRSRAESIAA